MNTDLFHHYQNTPVLLSLIHISGRKPVLYEKCEACDRTAYQNEKAKYETQKERLAGPVSYTHLDVYKRQSFGAAPFAKRLLV